MKTTTTQSMKCGVMHRQNIRHILSCNMDIISFHEDKHILNSMFYITGERQYVEAVSNQIDEYLTSYYEQVITADIPISHHDLRKATRSCEQLKLQHSVRHRILLGPVLSVTGERVYVDHLRNMYSV